MQCPKCKSAHVVRSHRRGLKENVMLGLFSNVMYLCRDCSHRFARDQRRHGSSAKKKTAERNRYLLIAAIVVSVLVAISIVEFSNRPSTGAVNSEPAER